jgi:hypothetical protein
MNFTTLKTHSENTIHFYSDIAYLPELQEFSTSYAYQNWQQLFALNSLLFSICKEPADKISFSWKFFEF